MYLFYMNLLKIVSVIIMIFNIMNIKYFDYDIDYNYNLWWKFIKMIWKFIIGGDIVSIFFKCGINGLIVIYLKLKIIKRYIKRINLM